MSEEKPLLRLHAEIDTRVQSIRADHADWLCGKGCDGCCRRLADIPRLTAAEWRLLLQGLNAMTAAKLEEIDRRMTALGSKPPRPVVCPLLDEASGACPVYAQRPVACRTYGFYLQRDLGLYCSDIESQVNEGMLSGVVWGNHDAVDRQLAALGDARPLTQWWADGICDGDIAADV